MGTSKYIFFGYTMFVLVYINNVQTTSRGCCADPKLHLLGRVGAKLYFVDNNNNVDWFEAKQYCENLGMVQATIQNEEELNFFINSTKPGIVYNAYWLGARDSHTLNQFHWVKGNETGTDIYVTMNITVTLLTPLTCGLAGLYPFSLYMYPCTYKASDLGTLCEIE